MGFRGDDRAVTVQIGAILLFGILIVSMSIYQVQVVPMENADTEYQHQQRVVTQLEDVRNAILRTGSTGSSQPVTVELGTEYDRRTFFVNPPPASGTISTESTKSITLRNVRADGEVADYLDGDHSFETERLTYDPGYHEWQSPPTTTYESSVLFSNYSSGRAVRTDQQLVDGRTITLVALDGSLSRSQVDAYSLSPRAASPSSSAVRTVTVQGSGADSPLTVEIPTTLGEPRWCDADDGLLADEIGDEGYIVSGECSVDDNRLTLTFKSSATYNLRLSKVVVGDGSTRTDAEYITDVGGTSVPATEGAQLVAEVRDEYNNPVSGVTVEVSEGDNLVRQSEQTTDSDGRVRFTYDADSGEDGTVELLISGADSDDAEKVVPFEFTDSGTDTGDAGGNGAYGIHWTDPSEDDSNDGLSDCDDERCTLDRETSTTVALTVDTSPTADGAPVEYAVNDTSVGTVSPTSGTTAHDGEATTTFTAKSAGHVKIYATSGAGGDTIELKVTGDGGLVYNEDAVAKDGQDDGQTPGGVEFTVRNEFDQSATITDVRIEPEDGDVDVIADGVGDEGPRKSEVAIDADGGDGYVDFSDLYFDGNARDGTALPMTADLDASGREHGGNPVLSSGSDARFYLYEFYEDSDGSANVDMNGKPVTITVSYRLDDGSTHQKQFVVTPGENGGDGDSEEISDPGQAFEDVDHDGEYDAETDVLIPDAAIFDGTYDADDNGLVIPSSVGRIEANSVSYTGSGVILDVPLAATGRVDINSNGRTLTIEGQSIDVNAGSEIKLSGTQIRAADSQFRTGGKITIQSTGAVTLDGASLTNNNYQSGDISISSGSGSSLSMVGAEVTTGQRVIIQSDGTLNVESTTIRNDEYNSGNVRLIAADGTVSGDGISVRTGKAIYIESTEGTSLVGATLDSTGYSRSDIGIEATDGDIDLTTATVSADGNARAEVSDGHSIIIQNANLDDINGKLDVEPDGAAVGQPNGNGQKTE